MQVLVSCHKFQDDLELSLEMVRVHFPTSHSSENLNLLEAAEEVKIGRLVVGLLKKKILSLKSAESTDQVPVKLNDRTC